MSAMEDERVHHVAQRAATKFGARFRHSDDFSVEWVEAKCDIVRAVSSCSLLSSNFPQGSNTKGRIGPVAHSPVPNVTF